MTREDYNFKLKDVRWKLKAENIIKRDKCCQVCNSTKFLNVHHLYYPRNKMPWEIEDEYLITLCNKCHKEEHVLREVLKRRLIEMRLSGIMAKDILEKLKNG